MAYDVSMFPAEHFTVKGWIEFDHYDKDRQLVEKRQVKNTLMNLGLSAVAAQICGVTAEPFNYIAIGTGTTAVAAANTALTGEATRSTAACNTVTTTQAGDTAQLVATFSFNAASAITESSVQDISAAGTMLSRATFSAINVASGDSLQATWKIKAA